MTSISKKAYAPETLLKGIGQIMLQENALTGLLFLAGITYGDWYMGLATVLATATGTVTAQLLGFGREEQQQGLYGFSPALVGVALTFMFSPTLLVWAAVVIGAAAAAVIQHYFIVKGVPVFTFPFVLVTWVIVYLLHQYTNIPPSATMLEPLTDSDVIDMTSSTNGFGEVIFQGSAFAGLIFFVAVFVNNPLSALYGLAGSILGALISFYFQEPTVQIHMGLFSFNAVLCAITFSGQERKDGVYVALSVCLATAINIVIANSNWSLLSQAGGGLTFPFVFASWITLLIKKILE